MLPGLEILPVLYPGPRMLPEGMVLPCSEMLPAKPNVLALFRSERFAAVLPAEMSSGSDVLL